MGRRETGIRGEELARELLKERGHRILETNYRCSHGEIDIITWQKDFLVFVEVRSKKNFQFGTPEESITSAKKGRMRAAALYYLQTHENLPPQWRIDVVVLELSRAGNLSRAEVIENAVGEE
ncbi:MAG: YraN family protein [Chloroflexi bacterium]|nr:YraN family protein [Chloroflexota bacterium]